MIYRYCCDSNPKCKYDIEEYLGEEYKKGHPDEYPYDTGCSLKQITITNGHFEKSEFINGKCLSKELKK